MYKMKPEYYTGILSIDKEHARLFELAQQTHDLLNNDILMDKTDSLTDLISELINYTRTHFPMKKLIWNKSNTPVFPRIWHSTVSLNNACWNLTWML